MRGLWVRRLLDDGARREAESSGGAHATGSPHVDLTRRLRDLSAARVSGRLDVIGSVGGRVYLDAGNVACAEQHGQQTMLLAMADAALFAPGEWTAALQAPPVERWRSLVGGDTERLRQLVDFAHDFTATHLEAILHGEPTSSVLVPGSTHALGTLATWSLQELLDTEEGSTSIDRGAFVDLLSEISPHIGPLT